MRYAVALITVLALAPFASSLAGADELTTPQVARVPASTVTMPPFLDQEVQPVPPECAEQTTIVVDFMMTGAECAEVCGGCYRCVRNTGVPGSRCQDCQCC